MRQVRLVVNAYEKALVFKNGTLVRVLDSGKYWISPWTNVMKYDITELFYHETELDLLLQCESFASKIDVVEVGDNQIAIQYKNGIFNKVLSTGRYPYWRNGLAYTYTHVDLSEIEVSQGFPRSLLHNAALQQYITVHVIARYEKALLYVDGALYKALDAGVYYFWKGSQNVILAKVDTRKQQVEVSGQELLTADKAAIRMSLFADYKVVNIKTALSESKDYARQLYVALQLALRAYVGQFTLDQLLRNKTDIAPYILENVKAKAATLGVHLVDCGVRDVILPGDIKEIMNQVLVAEKKAQANTIMRREETATTRSLLNTAKLMKDNAMLFKLKEMEYMEKVADKIGEITVNGGAPVVDQLRSLLSGK